MPPQALIFPFHDCPPEPESFDHGTRERIEVEHFEKRMNAYSKRIRKAKKNAIGKIEKNVFRHTAVSCLAVLHGFQQAADYCGHSLRTQGANYRNLVSKQDAKDYFNIMPPTGDGKVIPFDRSRGEALAVGKDGARQRHPTLLPKPPKRTLVLFSLFGRAKMRLSRFRRITHGFCVKRFAGNLPCWIRVFSP